MIIKGKRDFRTLLLWWNLHQNSRQMPWKGEKNPYLIWLSEIILQQTRVEQGLPYFLRFKQNYPTVKHLAIAKPDEVMKLWQGLGYYSRARNLHETAQHIHTALHGKFPTTFEEIKKLKGVGDYTASAFASFAFGEKKAVVDGNVIRVLARVFGVDTAFDTTAGKKQFAELAQELIDEEQPGAYNQAIMDFGAMVCTPQNPKCEDCVFNKMCVAYKQDLIDVLPVRSKKNKISSRYFTYLLIRNKKEILIEKREAKDIWQNLYQLPLIETDKPVKRNFSELISGLLGNKKYAIKTYSKEITQMLSHRKIHFRFVEIEADDLSKLHVKGSQKIKLKDLQKFAFPRTINLYLRENSLL